MGLVEREKNFENKHPFALTYAFLFGGIRYKFDIKPKDERGVWRDIYTEDPSNSNYEKKLHQLGRLSISTFFWTSVLTSSVGLAPIFENNSLSNFELVALLAMLEVLVTIGGISAVSVFQKQYTKRVQEVQNIESLPLIEQAEITAAKTNQ